MVIISSLDICVKSVFLGKYCLMSPLVCSFNPLIGKVEVCIENFRDLFMISKLLAVITGDGLYNRLDRFKHFNEGSSNYFSMFRWDIFDQRKFGLSIEQSAVKGILSIGTLLRML